MIEAVKRRDHWQALVPHFHIEDEEFLRTVAEPMRLDPKTLEEIDDQIVTAGYARLDSPDWQLDLPAMADAIERIVKAGWPAPFVFVFDELWSPFMRLGSFIASILGAEYRRLPAFWAWHVDPRKGQTGWPPHRDQSRPSLLPDGRPRSLTVWIALTEATPLNGCIYVVPADRDPAYAKWNGARPERPLHLPDIRALPAPAGGVLCWNQALMHWGGSSSPRAANVRMSIACEFQRGDARPFYEPLMDPRSSPDFALRLRLIGRQLVQYRHMAKLSAETEKMGRELVEVNRV
jgi:hypothetical protein